MRIVKEAEERKNEILDEAAALFAKKGYDGTSIGDILEKVGVARGTLYYHFRSKEEILDALVERISNSIIANSQTRTSSRTRIFIAVLILKTCPLSLTYQC